MGNAADKQTVKRSRKMDKQIIGEQNDQQFQGERNSELAPLMIDEKPQVEGLRHRKPFFNPNAKPFVPTAGAVVGVIVPMQTTEPPGPSIPPAVPVREPEPLVLTKSSFDETAAVVSSSMSEEKKVPPQLTSPPKQTRPQRAFTDITATTFGTSPVDPVHYREYTKKMMELAEKKKATFLFDIECYPPEIMKESLCICTYRKGNMVINTEAQHESEELAIEMAAKQMWEILK